MSTEATEHKHEHVHGEHCNHEHEHDDKSSTSSDEVDPSKKSNRNEKKFKKAMAKLGMKPVTGINRVTIRKGKAFMISIDNPEIMKSPGVENTFVIFGKPNMDDMGARLGQSEINKFAPQVPEPAAATETKEEPAASENVEDLNEEGISAENIKMVMDYAKSTKAEAIRALRESGNDSVNAIMKLTKSD